MENFEIPYTYFLQRSGHHNHILEFLFPLSFKGSIDFDYYHIFEFLFLLSFMGSIDSNHHNQILECLSSFTLYKFYRFWSLRLHILKLVSITQVSLIMVIIMTTFFSCFLLVQVSYISVIIATYLNFFQKYFQKN